MSPLNALTNRCRQRAIADAQKCLSTGNSSTPWPAKPLPSKTPPPKITLTTCRERAAADTDRAVLAAVKAQDDWRFVPAIEKCELLHAIARNVREHQRALAVLLTAEGGKPLIENMDEVEWVAACFDYYAEIGRHESGRVIPPVQRHQFNFVIKEPYGVVVCIVPWN